MKKSLIPNFLTTLRILIAPIVIVFLLCPFGPIVYHLDRFLDCSFQLSFLLSGVLFIIACVSDWCDGYLARKYQWISDFGKLWDPLADKILVNGVLICFAYLQLIPIWTIIIFITRDVVVDGLRMYSATKQQIVAANFYGKLKTVCQMFAIIVIFIFFNSTQTNDILWWCVQNLLILLSLLLSIISGCIYLYQTNKLNKPYADH